MVQKTVCIPKYTNDLIKKEMESFVNLETIQIAFPDIDIIFIKNIVLEILSEYRYFIND